MVYERVLVKQNLISQHDQSHSETHPYSAITRAAKITFPTHSADAYNEVFNVMINPGLERITRLLKHLPPQNFPTIHVAGTNGKGSVCTYLTALFQHHAKSTTSSPFQRVGRFTSPHLITPGDSITINNVPAASYPRLTKHVQDIDQRENIGASEFELLTATAFTIFAEEKVNLAIIECGMGGRQDATNVLVNPVVTVIARLGFDHQAFLGTTAEAIAMEKSGIMQRDVPCVVDSNSSVDFLAEVSRRAEIAGAPVTLTPSPHSNQKEFESIFAHAPPQTLKNDLPETARQNMWTAYLAYNQVLSRFSLPPTTDASTLVDVMVQALNPGRFQKLTIYNTTGRNSPIILDGAHNTQAFAALVQQVEHLRQDATESVTWVLASTDNRDPSELLALLPAQDRIVATSFSAVEGMPWVKPLAISQWHDILSKRGSPDVATWRIEDDTRAALMSACELAGEGPIVVAGSLYLIADVLRAVQSP